MARTVISVIELLVGMVCLGLGVAVWSRMRTLAVILAAAGLAAAIHAVVELL